MKAAIVFLVISMGSLLLSRVFNNIGKDSFENKPETIGTITRVIVGEGGRIMYYVSFVTKKEQIFEGQSIYYSCTNGKYKINDSVQIKYFITEKGQALVSIIDDDLIPCRLGMVKATKNMKIASIVFFVLAVGSFLF